MLEEIDCWELITGEFYFIKNDILKQTIRKAKMVTYTDLRHAHPVAIFYVENEIGACLLRFENWTFYRYVSSEEYREKLIKKFQDTCVNVILKQIINETFVW